MMHTCKHVNMHLRVREYTRTHRHTYTHTHTHVCGQTCTQTHAHTHTHTLTHTHSNTTRTTKQSPQPPSHAYTLHHHHHAHKTLASKPSLLMSEPQMIATKYGGRPHFGKVNYISYDQMAPLFPRFHDFVKLRAQLDPHNMFLNAYLSNLLLPFVADPTPSPAASITKVVAPEK
jgi:hypothetical protein